MLDVWSEQFWLFLVYMSHILPSFKSIGLSVQEKKRKLDFQEDDHLGFSIGMILATFDLQVTLMLPTKFQSVGHNSSAWALRAQVN